MRSLDIIASILIGAYLLAVSLAGNSGELISQAKKDVGFLKWALALGVLWYLYGIKELRGVISLLIVGAIIGFLLIAGGKFTGGVSDLWAKIGSQKTSDNSAGNLPGSEFLLKSH